MPRISIQLSWSVLCAALLVVALVASGCGGSDGDSTAAALTKAEYVKQADAVCGKAEKRQLARVEAFSKKGLKQTEKSEEELVVYAGIPPLAQEAEELNDVPLPSSGGKEAKAFVVAFEKGVKEAEKNPAAMLSLETNPFKKSQVLAKKFGFAVCGGA